MEIKTDFNINDEVLFIDSKDGKPKKGRLYEIQVNVSDTGTMISYGVKRKRQNSFLHEYFIVAEGLCFKTKDEVFEYLYKLGENI